jgi:long-chain acyl-CoA synthetase
MLGLIAHGRVLTMVYAIQSPEAMAGEILDTRFGAVIADIQDWTPQMQAAVREIGAAGIILDHNSITIEPACGFDKAGSGPFSAMGG